MNHARPPIPSRGVTIIELVVTMALLTALVAGTVLGLQTQRRVHARNELMTRLSMRANSDLVRLQAEPYADWTDGRRTLQDPRLPRAAGLAEIQSVPELGIKELTVSWEQDTPSGPCRVVLATCRGPVR